MTHRRDFIGGALAFGVVSGFAPSRALAQDRYDQAALLMAEPFGNLTLCHLSDLRAQLTPHYYRPPARLPDEDGGAPSLGSEAFRVRYGIGGANPMDYALTPESFAELAQAYGPMGGLAHVATLVRAIRNDRPGALLLLSGESGGGSYLSDNAGMSEVWDVIAALAPDAVSAANGAEPVDALPDAVELPAVKVFEREGIRIAVIGHVPLPAAEAALRGCVARTRKAGARVVIWMSGNGIAMDRAFAPTAGVDVILSSGHHDALPEPIEVGTTRIVASGGQGRFVSRLDLEVTDEGVAKIQQTLIPVFAELIVPDAQMARRIAKARAPHLDDMTREIGRAEGLLYRRGLYESTWDDVLCDALRAHHGAQIALVPGLRWGRTVLAGRPVTGEDLHALTSSGPSGTQLVEMTGAALRDRLEDAADAVFGKTEEGGPQLDMLRTGGLSYRIAPGAAKGARIDKLSLHPGGEPLAADQTYAIALWEGDTGPNMVDLLAAYIHVQDNIGADTGPRVDVI